MDTNLILPLLCRSSDCPNLRLATLLVPSVDPSPSDWLLAWRQAVQYLESYQLLIVWTDGHTLPAPVIPSVPRATHSVTSRYSGVDSVRLTKELRGFEHACMFVILKIRFFFGGGVFAIVPVEVDCTFYNSAIITVPNPQGTEFRKKRWFQNLSSFVFLFTWFSPEDGGSIFIRNVGLYLLAYTAS